jgi:uncharacterized protein YcaQ
MLTKYLVGKPTRLWDEYLHQAPFAARIRVHATTKRSPFYPVYGLHPRIPSDSNEPIDEDAQPEAAADHLRNVAHARALANELLLNRAIRTKRIHDEAVKLSSFAPGQWVSVRNEEPVDSEKKAVASMQGNRPCTSFMRKFHIPTSMGKSCGISQGSE